MFVNDLSYKEFISKINKELTLNTQNANNPIKKWAEDLTHISPKKKLRWPTGT